jgi:hypothetical protein
VINGVNDRVEDKLFNRVLDLGIGKSISNIINNELGVVNDVVLDLLIKGGNNGVVRYTTRPSELCQGLFLTMKLLYRNVKFITK